MSRFDATRISDPVHGAIYLSELERRLIGTRAFQRLRNVKQLGLAHYVFPSADYSRLSHSLGVCHITRLILETLCRNSANVSISDDEVQLYLGKFSTIAKSMGYDIVPL